MNPLSLAAFAVLAMASAGAVQPDKPIEVWEAPEDPIFYPCQDLIRQGLRCPLGVFVEPGSSPRCDSGFIMPSCDINIAELRAVARLHESCEAGQVHGELRLACGFTAVARAILNDDVPHCYAYRENVEIPICYEFVENNHEAPKLAKPTPPHERHPGRIMAAT